MPSYFAVKDLSFQRENLREKNSPFLLNQPHHHHLSTNKMATPNDTTKDAALDVSSNQIQESPWKKMKPTEDANLMAQQEKIMKAENVSHSKYVPAQLERHLEFMQTNDGRKDFKLLRHSIYLKIYQCFARSILSVFRFFRRTYDFGMLQFDW